jgi:hypothetical protein
MRKTWRHIFILEACADPKSISEFQESSKNFKVFNDVILQNTSEAKSPGKEGNMIWKPKFYSVINQSTN